MVQQKGRLKAVRKCFCYFLLYVMEAFSVIFRFTFEQRCPEHEQDRLRPRNPYAAKRVFDGSTKWLLNISFVRL